MNIEEKIVLKLRELEAMKEEINRSPLKEQIMLTRDLNNIQSKINVLKEILGE